MRVESYGSKVLDGNLYLVPIIIGISIAVQFRIKQEILYTKFEFINFVI
jgi:hypothetical protein